MGRLSRVVGALTMDSSPFRIAFRCVSVAPMPIDAPPPVVQQVIVSPRAGQRVTRPPLRLVVRAGREHSDLAARLNGVAIGDDFVRASGTLRRLNVSASHGLRHGRNVLTVRARIGTTVRRQRVVFTIAGRHPIPGAGRHRRSVAGRWIRLQGRVVKHPRGERASAIRWSIVQAPKGSRLRTATRDARASKAAARRALARGIRRPGRLRPSFRPDTAGRYVLKLTIGSGAATRSATVAVDAGPVAGAVAFDSAIDGAAPSGARDDRTPYGRPGIRVGAVVYRAPWLTGSGSQGSYAGTAGSVQYRALWQVLVLDRRTLAPISNTTYGRCDGSGAGALHGYVCAPDGSGSLADVDLRGRLAALGSDALVVAVSHPGGGGQYRYTWDTPQDPFDAPTPLTEVGFPADPAGGPKLLDGVPAGGVALVGVGGLAAGAGRSDVAGGGGEARLSGQLVADVLGDYGYVSGQRAAFDTRAQGGCTGCAAAITVAGRTVATSTPANAASGLLVAAYDERTLALRAKQELVSGAGTQPETVLADLAAFITQQSSRGTVFAVTSFGPAMLTEGAIDRQSSTAAGAAIVSIGGTLDGFFRAIVTGTNGGYSLIGWAGAGAGRGVEASGAGARLRGVLPPDAAGHMRPANVSADGPPAEQLQQLLVSAPSTGWRYDDDPDRKAAILWIGDQSRRLGGDPRQAYWQLDRADLTAALQDVENVAYPGRGATFSAAAFADASAQVGQELEWAGEVRDYLATLAAPAAQTSGTVWEQATILQNRLSAQLRIDTQQAKANAFWMGVVESVLDLAGGLGSLVRDAEKFGAAMASMAAGLEAAQAGWSASESGAAPVDSVPRVAVDDLAVYAAAAVAEIGRLLLEGRHGDHQRPRQAGRGRRQRRLHAEHERRLRERLGAVPAERREGGRERRQPVAGAHPLPADRAAQLSRLEHRHDPHGRPGQRLRLPERQLGRPLQRRAARLVGVHAGAGRDARCARSGARHGHPALARLDHGRPHRHDLPAAGRRDPRADVRRGRPGGPERPARAAAGAGDEQLDRQLRARRRGQLLLARPRERKPEPQ